MSGVKLPGAEYAARRLLWRPRMEIMSEKRKITYYIFRSDIRRYFYQWSTAVVAASTDEKQTNRRRVTDSARAQPAAVIYYYNISVDRRPRCRLFGLIPPPPGTTLIQYILKLHIIIYYLPPPCTYKYIQQLYCWLHSFYRHTHTHFMSRRS